MFKTLRRIHNDERGLETLQVVMIIAIAALILGLLKLAWPTIKTWFSGLVKNITGWQGDQAF
ncbi:MAG TPA: hypothetical protein VH643_21010 [Gemmataceae bacterium]|jgi:phosphotransferase system  glucose/maltose/N-acetylglucosamine-specific IIC component